ncbi:MAG: 4-alpha-glucanotransferase, partial [Frankiales bacterium]|nr:4-alpha-glucanotransferase [Frankiales bacterium]
MTDADKTGLDLELAALATAHGVATDYLDQLQRGVDVRPESIVAILGALGVDATSPAAVRDALDNARHNADAPPPVVVLRTSEQRALDIRGRARLVLETGESRDLDQTDVGIAIPAGLPLGWHQLDTADGEIPVVVAPDRLVPPPGRHWGWAVQLYAMPSQASWGLGDIADL